jgi:hypothetical protein
MGRRLAAAPSAFGGRGNGQAGGPRRGRKCPARRRASNGQGQKERLLATKADHDMRDDSSCSVRPLAYDFEQLFCGCRPECKSFLAVMCCDRVRSSVRPQRCGLSGAAGRYGDLRIRSKSCSRALSSKSCTGLPNPDLFDHLPIRVVAFSHPVTGIFRPLSAQAEKLPAGPL